MTRRQGGIFWESLTMEKHNFLARFKIISILDVKKNYTWYLVLSPKLSYEILEYLTSDTKVEHVIEPSPSSPVVIIPAAIITK